MPKSASVQRREWRANNLGRQRATERAYVERNREKINARTRARRAENRENANTKRKEYRASNREKMNAHEREKRAKNPVPWLIRLARARAKEVGVECTLIATDVTVPERCPWLDIPLAPGTGKLHDNSPTLDRIIPEIGYVPGNVIVISHRANRIKNSSSPEELARVLRGLRSAYPQWLLID